jgi:hypothetical protein
MQLSWKRKFIINLVGTHQYFSHLKLLNHSTEGYVTLSVLVS